MAYEAKFIIAAENRVKQGLDDAKKDLTGFSDAAENIGKRLKEALTVTAIVVGFEKLGKAVFECFQEFGEAERRLLRLKVALGDNESSVSKMERLIGDLKKQTLASKDEIENLVGELAMLGKSDTEIEKISRATVNLSNVTGQDLNSAFILINGTFTGTAGRLERLIPQIGDLKKEQLEAGGAVDLINGKFGEMSAQLAENNIPQKIKNIQDAWGDFKENLGEAVAPIFNPILEGINRIIEGWNNAAKAAKLHDQILTSSSYTQKIALTQSLLETQKEQLRLFDQGIGGKTIERIQKQLTSRDLDPQTKMMLQESLDVWQGQRDAIVSAINVSEATITDLKRIWQKIPTGKLAPQDLIPTVSLLGQPTGGAGGGNGGRAGETPDEKLLSKFAPITTGPYSARGYAFAMQYWEQFEKPQPFDLLKSLSDAYAGNIDIIGDQLSGAANNLATIVEGDIVPEADRLSIAMAGITGTVEGEIGPVFSNAINEIDFAQIGEAMLLNFAPPKTKSEELSEAYAGNVDAIGATTGRLSGVLTSATTDIESYSDALSDAMAGMTDAILTFNPALEKSVEELNTNLLLYEESFLLNFAPPKTLEEQLSEAYAGNVDIIGGTSGIPASLSQDVSEIANYTKLLSTKSWFRSEGKAIFQPLERTPGEKISDIGVKLYNWGNNKGGTVGNIASGAGGLIASAGLGLDKIFGPIGGLVDKFLGIISSVGALQQILDPVTTILQAAFQVIQPMLDTILTPIVGILQILGQTIGQLLLPILQALTPIVKFLGDAFVWLYNSVVLPVGNLMYKIFATIWNAIASAINFLLGWLGVHLGTIDTSIDVLKKIDAGALQTAGASAVGQTAAQSANYRSQSITINIYQEAPVVGSGGMTEFARIIRGEFERLGYYGA